MNLNERLPLLLALPADLDDHIVTVDAIAWRQVLPGDGLQCFRMPGTTGVGTPLRTLCHTAYARHRKDRLGATLVAPLNQAGTTQRTGRQFTGVHG